MQRPAIPRVVPARTAVSVAAEARLVPVIAGAAVSTAALAVFGRIAGPFTPLGWAVLVPWLLGLDATRSVREALAAGLLLSAGFVLVIFPWFPAMVADYTGGPWLVGVACLALLAPVIEPQFVAFAVARHLARRLAGGARWWLPAVVGAGVYVGTEWAWPKLFADTLAHGLYPAPRFRQAADVVGVHGLTYALVLGNECVLALVRGGRPAVRRIVAPAACLVVLVGGLAGYGAVRLAALEARPFRDPVGVVAVQANIAHYDRLRAEVGTYEAVRQILDTHFALSADALAARRPDLVVWPETVYPTTFGTPTSEDGAAFDRAIAAFVVDHRVPLLFGAYAAEDGKQFNAAFLVEPAGGRRVVVDAYRKSILFPFTEYLPWPLESARVRRWLPWAGTWTRGDGPGVLSVDLADGRTVRVAPLVCYDALETGFVVGAVRQGADALVVLSNDSWFDYPGVQRLIMIVAAFRSIETRRPQLRATPTGVSALIDDTGALVDSVGVDERGVLAGTLRPAHGAWTLVLAWGDWLPPAALALALALLAASRVRRG
jgi:apolipoprotein N-acyltransferase